MHQPIYTIGHSNHTAEHFAALLREHEIDAVVDVRSQPTSGYSPHFNRSALPGILPDSTRYAFMGHKLGGRPVLDEFYDEAGHVLYGPLSRSADFQGGLDLIERNRGSHRIALLCSEADPLSCHRRILIARSLLARGVRGNEILHILGDGTVRTELDLPYLEPMLEELWRSPLSVSPVRQPSLSFAESDGPDYHV